MITFRCRVVTPEGVRKELVRTAVSEEVLVRDLNTEGLNILQVVPVDHSGAETRGRLKSNSILKFTEVLSTLLSNGLALKDALILAQTLATPDLRPFLGRLVVQVQKGQSLHQALGEGYRGFSSLYLGLVRIGEQTGDLNQIFPRITDYLRTRQTLRQKTINALIYPVFVLTVAVVGVVLLALFVLPILTGAINGINPDAARQYRENVSGFQVLAIALVIVLGTMGGVGALSLVLARQRSDWALRIDRLVLSVPIWGSLVWQNFGLNIAFAMEILLASGFSLEAALSECLPLVANRHQKLIWEKVRQKVVHGIPFSQALREEPGIPQVLLGWIEVGEAAHDLKRSFQQLRLFYQNQLEVAATRFTNLAEPVLIVLVGGLMTVLVLTFITPVFSMLGRLY